MFSTLKGRVSLLAIIHVKGETFQPARESLTNIRDSSLGPASRRDRVDGRPEGSRLYCRRFSISPVVPTRDAIPSLTAVFFDQTPVPKFGPFPEETNRSAEDSRRGGAGGCRKKTFHGVVKNLQEVEVNGARVVRW